MGAVLFSRNDLNVRDPEAAARLEHALARAVAYRVGAFRVSIQRPLGASDVIVQIEAHRPGAAPWRRELRIDPELQNPHLEAHITGLID